MDKEFQQGRRLVRISGTMLGTWSEDRISATQIQATSLICVDISGTDVYPNPPNRVWHPEHGKCWYIDSDHCTYEWLDDDQEVVGDNSNRLGESNHSGR